MTNKSLKYNKLTEFQRNLVLILKNAFPTIEDDNDNKESKDKNFELQLGFLSLDISRFETMEQVFRALVEVGKCHDLHKVYHTFVDDGHYIDKILQFSFGDCIRNLAQVRFEQIVFGNYSKGDISLPRYDEYKAKLNNNENKTND